MNKNKGITSILYNHLNLPVEIIWSSTKKIEYLYNAAGVKVQKKVTNGTSIKTTDYLDGFQYNEQVLEFFPTSEGYVKATPTGLVPPGTPPSAYAFNYVFNYTDHLGNVRVSYTKDPQTGNLKILDESHYYPFGLKHQEYSTFGFVSNPIQGVIIAPVANNPFKYKYNGKELQDELGLGLYDYGARNYDPALGRWNVTDSMAPKYFSHSPYAYSLNNPVYFIDPDGMQVSNGEEEDDDEEVYYGVVGLGVASVSGGLSNYSLDFLLSYRYSSFTSFIFGADGEKSIHRAYRNMLSPENREGYMKMQQAKREGEWFTVGILSMPFMVAAAPEVIAYGSIVAETSYGSYIMQTLGRTGIDATAQYLITGDVNWLNAAAGSVLPGKAGTALSPLLSETSDAAQIYVETGKFNPTQSALKIGANYLGNGLGGAAKSVGADNGFNAAQNFIFENGIQSFHNNLQGEIISDGIQNTK